MEQIKQSVATGKFSSNFRVEVEELKITAEMPLTERNTSSQMQSQLYQYEKNNNNEELADLEQCFLDYVLNPRRF